MSALAPPLAPALVAAPPSGWRAVESPFHAGELAAQERAGVRERMDVDARRGIRDYMPEQHRRFFAEQPFMVLGGVDETGQPWATLRVGATGFISTPDERTLRIAGRSLAGDPLAGTWQIGSVVGGLGIQPATRRRNRVNGVITAIDDHAITLAVSQSYGNCAKYIQSRTPVEFILEQGSQPALVSNRLNDADRALLTRADTFFVASANTSSEAGMARGADVSHRGGKPGFIRVDEDDTLTTPDFTGNLFFNTIGNLMQDPRAGLLLIDFDSGDLLYLAVDAEIIWEGPELESFDGAERLIRWHVREVRRTPHVLPMRWSGVQYAPQLARTGDWKPATTEPTAASTWRKLAVARIQDEAPGVRSFYLQPADGSTLKAFEPGQFLPIRLPIPGLTAPLIRTYTLSDAYNRQYYRITVKREGVASTWLHENVVAGMEIEASTPRGAFVLDRASGRPVVLLSAGIGITPMIAMLNSLLADKSGSPHPEHIHFIHGARRPEEHPFADELRNAQQLHSHLSVYLRESHGDVGPVGRVNIDYLKSVLPFGDYDFYLCGPGAFMQDMYSGLRSLNIADDRIRFEAFGPASVKRTESTVPAAVKPVTPRDPERSSKVVFMRSQRDARWSPEDGSLLDFAEANGVVAASMCRSGACGTCATRVLSGDVTYPVPCDGPIPEGHALICSAIPAKMGSGEDSVVVLDL
jgi:uncharacterized protein